MLYDSTMALISTSSTYSYDEAEKACPVGWRLPTRNEVTFIEELGGKKRSGVRSELGFDIPLNGLGRLEDGILQLENAGSYWTSTKYKVSKDSDAKLWYRIHTFEYDERDYFSTTQAYGYERAGALCVR